MISLTVQYVELIDMIRGGKSFWGVGIDEDVTEASLHAVLSAASSAMGDVVSDAASGLNGRGH